MDDRSMALLKNLSESFGPTGFESETAGIVADYAAKLRAAVEYDKMGSVLFSKKGKENPRVLLAAHMDEVGFIVTAIEESGFLKFGPLGGWFDQVVLGQRVKVRNKNGDTVTGVIAAKPPHLLPAEKRKESIDMDRMFIDVGCSCEEEVEALGIRIGSPVVPESAFTIQEKSSRGKGRKKERIFMGKGFDDRVGIVCMCEVIRNLKAPLPNNVIAAATVQEEVGLRGARTVAHKVKPDVAIVLETEIAGDVPGIQKHEATSRLGGGPAICVYDRSMIPNQKLLDMVIETAEKGGIEYQLTTAKGGTDGGQIHLSYEGCPTIVIGVPTRHIHSPVGVIAEKDVDLCIKLVTSVVQKLDEKTVASLTMP